MPLASGMPLWPACRICPSACCSTPRWPWVCPTPRSIRACACWQAIASWRAPIPSAASRNPPNAGQEEIDPGLSFAIQEVIDACGPDSVLVIATQGIASHANWGGNMAVRASMVGAQGLVTDGAVRDLHEMEELGMNIFAQGTSPRAGQHRLATTLRNQPVMCAGVYIRPGDILVGDGDGVIVIDPAQAEQIAAKAHELLRIESDMQNYMRNGASLLQAVKKYRIR